MPRAKRPLWWRPSLADYQDLARAPSSRAVDEVYEKHVEETRVALGVESIPEEPLPTLLGPNPFKPEHPLFAKWEGAELAACDEFSRLLADLEEMPVRTRAENDAQVLRLWIPRTIPRRLRRLALIRRRTKTMPRRFGVSTASRRSSGRR